MSTYILVLTTQTKRVLSGETVGIVRFAFKPLTASHRSAREADAVNERAFNRHVGPTERAWKRHLSKGAERPTLWVYGKFTEGAEVYEMWPGDHISISDDVPRKQVGVLHKQWNRSAPPRWVINRW